MPWNWPQGTGGARPDFHPWVSSRGDLSSQERMNPTDVHFVLTLGQILKLTCLLSLILIRYCVKPADRNGRADLKPSPCHLIPHQLGAGAAPGVPPAQSSKPRQGEQEAAHRGPASWGQQGCAAPGAPSAPTTPTTRRGPTDPAHLGAGVPGWKSCRCWEVAQSLESGCSDGFSACQIQPEKPTGCSTAVSKPLPPPPSTV